MKKLKKEWKYLVDTHGIRGGTLLDVDKTIVSNLELITSTSLA